MSNESEDESEKPTKIYLGREEIRGLFTLGLLAVITAIRIQYIALNREITIPINGTQYDVTPFFDWMIVLWSLYAFFMVLGLSDDIIGEKASKGLRRISRYYLYVSFLILGFFAIVFYYSIYPLQAIGLSVFAVAIFVYWFTKQIYMLAKKIKKKGLSVKSLPRKLLDYLKSEWYQFLGSVAILCLLLVVAGTHNEFIIPSSIIGSISLILFLIMRNRKVQRQKSNLHSNRDELAV
jgi:hypothetical protein